MTPELRELLAHCADALGMDVDDEAGPYEAVALAENILEAIGFVDEVVDTDSRTVIADRLLEALEADSVADPDDAPAALAAALGLAERRQGTDLVEALMDVAVATAARSSPPSPATARHRPEPGGHPLRRERR